MLERIPLPYRQDAADHANRLSLLKADLRVIELAIEGKPHDEEEHDAIVLSLRRMIADVDELHDDVLERDHKARQEVRS